MLTRKMDSLGQKDRILMRKIALIVILMSICAVARAFAYDNGDFQVWHTENQEARIHKNVKVTTEQELRFGDAARELYYQHYDWGTSFGFDKRLDIGFNFRKVYEKKKDKWMEEDRPHINAVLKFDIWKIKFENRNRLEFRIFKYRDDHLRYRDKFTVKYPVKLFNVTVSPYAADEIFISSNATGFNENRIYSGFEIEITKNIKADISYLQKTNRVKDDKWLASNVLATKIKISF